LLQQQGIALIVVAFVLMATEGGHGGHGGDEEQGKGKRAGSA
jgi:hypothetical protein